MVTMPFLTVMINRGRRELLGGTAGQGYPDPQENITLGSSVAAVPVLASARRRTHRDS